MKPPFVIRRLLEFFRERSPLSICHGDGSDQAVSHTPENSGMKGSPQTPWHAGIHAGADPASRPSDANQAPGPSDGMGAPSGPSAASRHPPIRCRSYCSPMEAPSLEASPKKALTYSEEAPDPAGQLSVHRDSPFMDIGKHMRLLNFYVPCRPAPVL